MKKSEFMCSAYKLLYEIETTLREQIKQSLTLEYGRHWKYKINVANSFSSTHFHELIPYFAKYTPLLNFYSEQERKKLYNLIPILNKICHMRLLRLDEFNKLNEVHNLVLSRLMERKSSYIFQN